jgi:uncharacterized protein DUF4282
MAGFANVLHLVARAVRFFPYTTKESAMNWGDFISFRKMVTPVIIQVIFWVGVVVCVLGGLGSVIGGRALYGLFLIVLGPIIVRIECELLILLFRIHDAVQEIRASKRG